MNTNQKQGTPDEQFERRMRAKQELWKTIHHHDINTSTIYCGLQEKWKSYDGEIISQVEEGLHVAHAAKKVMSYCNDGSEIAQGKINGHMSRLMSDRRETLENGSFPIEHYYMGGYYNEMEYIVWMGEHCVVEKEGHAHDLLFAVQFSLTPIQECGEFLGYQLQKTFSNNIEEFTAFLDNICLEYKSFLAEKHEIFYRRYMEKIQPTEEKTNEKNGSQPRVKLNWHGQSNALTYLFRQLKMAAAKNGQPLISNSYEEIASFIKENYEGFESIKLSTIIGQLKKTDKPKKADKKIEIFI